MAVCDVDVTKNYMPTKFRVSTRITNLIVKNSLFFMTTKIRLFDAPGLNV